MAKHPVPKKKVSQARTAMRYGAFATKKKRKLTAFLNIILCKSCGSPTLNQHACAACGMYRDRSVRTAVVIAPEQIKKIKA